MRSSLRTCWWLGGLLLAVLLGVRLVGLDNPLVGKHHWRQTDTAGTIRNFHETGKPIWLPQVDWRGETPGYGDMEFPVYQYAVARVYDLLGPWEGWARLASLLGFAASALLLGLLVAESLTPAMGLWSAVFYSSLTTTLYYSRVPMPEAWMLCGQTMALYGMWRYAGRPGLDAPGGFGRPGWLLFSWVGFALACLIKITPLCLGLPLAWMLWRGRGLRAVLRPWFVVYLGATVVLLAGWYGYGRWLHGVYGLGYNVGALDKVLTGKALSLGYWNLLLFQRLAGWHLSWPLFLLTVAGIAWPAAVGRAQPLHYAWLLAMAVYVALVDGGNAAHDYYQLPVLLPLCVFAARGFVLALDAPARQPWLRGMALAALGLQLLLGGLHYQDLLARERPDHPTLRLAAEVRRIAAPEELVWTVTNGNPGILYHADRKGWTMEGQSRDFAARLLASRAVCLAAVGDSEYLADGGRTLAALRGLFCARSLVVDAPDMLLVDLRQARECH